MIFQPGSPRGTLSSHVFSGGSTLAPRGSSSGLGDMVDEGVLLYNEATGQESDPNASWVCSISPTSRACEIARWSDPNIPAAPTVVPGGGLQTLPMPSTPAKPSKPSGGYSAPKPVAPVESTADSMTTPMMIVGGLVLLGIGYAVVKRRKDRGYSASY